MSSILNDIRCVGVADGESPVLYGEDVFKVMDENGIPLKEIVEALRGIGTFDLHGFIRAAKSSGKYTNDKLKMMILSQERLHEVCAKMVQ
jgi:hypothetical protein